MKHAEPAQFDQSEIRQGEMSAWRLVPDVARALMQPVHMLSILDKIAAVGDRVRLTDPKGRGVHFLFHPNDIDQVLRVQQSKTRLSDRQHNVLNDEQGKPRPIMTNLVGPDWLKSRVELAKKMHPQKGVSEPLLASYEDELDQVIDRLKKQKSVSLARISAELVTRMAYQIMFGIAASEDSCIRMSNATKDFNRRQFKMGITNGAFGILFNNSPSFRKAITIFQEEVASVQEKYLKGRAHRSHPVVLDSMFDEQRQNELEQHIRMLMRGSQGNTTYALFSVLWNLASKPDHQEQIAHNGTSNAIVKQTLLESLRFTPPAYMIPKDAAEDITLDERLKIFAGDSIIISPYITHKNPNFYEDPENYNPEVNFANTDETTFHKGAFIPFGIGPRKCPARGFVEQIVSMTTVKMCEAFEFSRQSNQTFPSATFNMVPDPTSHIALRPRSV